MPSASEAQPNRSAIRAERTAILGTPGVVKGSSVNLGETEDVVAIMFVTRTGNVNEPRYSVMARAKATSSAAHDIASALR